MRFRTFEEIDAWQKSRELNRAISRVTRRPPWCRDFVLRNQTEKASLSIMSNIAEGFERNGNAEFVQFLFISKASCGEVRSQLYVALDEEYISGDEFHLLSERAKEVSRLLGGLITYLQTSELKGPKFK
ncbi:MAG TPA: four helix bundle protein [Thermoanaerobaculia bacterium]